MDFRKKIRVFSLGMLLTVVFSEQLFAVPAFPGAEGPGAETIGGRGGRIIEVTNLNDSGNGSLRAGIEASGRRIIVFKVAGIIDLDRVIYIKNPYLTIAGQTAPKGGITLKGRGIQLRTHDVIMRYIKSRPGIDRGDYNTDGLGMQGSGDLYRNILDHCSLSWANDENAQIWSKSETIAPHHITYSWNILSEGFSGHSCGFLLGASNDSSNEMKDIAIHHNLFASNHHRNPMMKIKEVKFINNLVYNWDYYASATTGGVRLDIIGNKYKMGPTTPSYRFHELIVKSQAEIADGSTGVDGDPEIYIKGNIGPRQSDENADNWGMTSTYYDRDSLDRKYERRIPLKKATFPIAIDSVTKAEQKILTESGASQRINERGEWVANRDTVDQRIINDYKNGTGSIPASENDVGGYPTIHAGTPYADSDHDGMANVWEDLYGLDKYSYDDNAEDKDGDGYTNIEEFINGTNPGDNVNNIMLAKELVVEEPAVEEPAGTIKRKVLASTDDAEERADGGMYLNSSDLELIYDYDKQTVGIRFSNLAIPKNAIITKAYIQFKVDEDKFVSNTVINIRGEKGDNALPFTTAKYNISSRIQTNAFVPWSPARWDSIGERGADQRTSDLSSLVQEIVSGSGWSTGNAMAFIISGDGKRVAESYDGDQAGAPMLYVEYTIEMDGGESTSSPSDTTLPVITLLGSDPMNLAVGDTFNDPGVTAQDNTDGDLTDSVQDSSNINMDVGGTYQIIYTVSDSDGNRAKVSRNVVVSNENSEQYTLKSRVSASTDDAEERADGGMYLNSSDLELIYDNDNQTVGIRFTNLAIPQNATITQAYIQFETDENDFVADTVLTIYAEKEDSVSAFTKNAYDISSRNKTNASILWSPGRWGSIGDSGEEQRTTDLRSIVQEIVSQLEWNSGNAMAFIFTGKGKRVAESYDGNPTGAPMLYVKYSY